MDLNDPVQKRWLGKIQEEMGVQVTNGLLSDAKIEFLEHVLTKTAAENEALKAQVQDMGQTNTALREEVIRLTEQLQLKLKARGRPSNG
jgi:hypothetical protein